jgi:hypothetical protein
MLRLLCLLLNPTLSLTLALPPIHLRQFLANHHLALQRQLLSHLAPKHPDLVHLALLRHPRNLLAPK